MLEIPRCAEEFAPEDLTAIAPLGGVGRALAAGLIEQPSPAGAQVSGERALTSDRVRSSWMVRATKVDLASSRPRTVALPPLPHPFPQYRGKPLRGTKTLLMIGCC